MISTNNISQQFGSSPLFEGINITLVQMVPENLHS